MHGYMNVEAFKRTIETKEAHYFSRSRKEILISKRVVLCKKLLRSKLMMIKILFGFQLILEMGLVVT